jgi:hypothetical protein
MALAAAALPLAPARLVVSLHRIVDWRLKNSNRVQHFCPSFWNEAARDYGQTPGDNPIFAGSQRGKINLVAADTIPMYRYGGRHWQARASTTSITNRFLVFLRVSVTPKKPNS